MKWTTPAVRLMITSPVAGPSILLSMNWELNWTTPAVTSPGLMMTTPVVGPSLLRMLIAP